MARPSRRARRFYEHGEQALLVARFRLAFPHLARLLFAIPNGGRRSPREAARLKAEGVVAGTPDLMLAVARGEHHGLFIEMKRADGRGRLSEDQVTQALLLIEQGYLVVACAGHAEAWRRLVMYISPDEAEQEPTSLARQVLRRGGARSPRGVRRSGPRAR